MGYPFDEESALFTNPVWDQLDAYIDQFPWIARIPGERTRFDALDDLNRSLAEYSSRPEVVAEEPRCLALANAMGRQAAGVLDQEILAILRA